MTGHDNSDALLARIRALEEDNRLLRTSLAEAEARAARSPHELLLADGMPFRESPLACAHPSVARRVSIIIPAYNASAFLGRAAQSVWAQTYPHESIEILIVDDGSTDGSHELANRLRRMSPVPMRVLQHEGGRNRGVAPTRQLAVREATGEFVALLDADDAFLPDRVHATVEALTHDGNSVAVCSLGRNVDVDGQTVTGHNGTTQAGEWRGLPDAMAPPFTFDQLWRVDPIVNSSLTIRRSALEAVGGFPSLMAHQAEDWLLVLKLSRLAPIPCLDRELMLYTHHPGAYTHAYHAQGWQEGVRVEVFYHLAWWMLQSADHVNAGTRFFRREYPRLIAEHQRFLPILRTYYAEGGRPAGGAPPLAEHLARLTSELETLRRTIQLKLRENKRLRQMVATLPDSGRATNPSSSGRPVDALRGFPTPVESQ